jgi:hypothetical protein
MGRQRPCPHYFKKEEKVLISINKLKLNHGAFFELGWLAEDIQKNGLKEPLIVVLQEDSYLVVDGNHRLVVLRSLGWKEIPCYIAD